MIVKELIELLKDMPQDSVVIMSTDGDDNGFSPLLSIDSNTLYLPANKYCGGIYSNTISEQDIKYEESRYIRCRPKGKMVPSILLKPVR
ncbi:hypothetical protein JZU46_06165 [bacterium]|nr:hypothetical protein [bacterium]